MRVTKLCLLCAVLMMCLAGCGSNSGLKEELNKVTISGQLPEVTVRDCRYLDQADEAVYEQQKAACLMYYEAYESTNPATYTEAYGEKIKPERVAAYCNERRKELDLDIATELIDNVREMVRVVEDCENIEAYLERVDYDVFTFYDYYAKYILYDDREDIICTILKSFYERSNIFALSFMQENKDEFIDTALARIVENSLAESDYNMYIAENNELIRALNMVYGGVSSEYAQIITETNTKLIRNMLEDDSELDEASINALMYQLGEPTPTPVPTPTPTPTIVPTETPQPTVMPQPTQNVAVRPVTPAPVRTNPPKSYVFE